MAEKNKSSGKNSNKKSSKEKDVKKSQKLSSEDRTLCIITHVLGLIASFVGPLIIYLVSENKTVKEHSRQALNWQISAVIYFIISTILVFIFIGVLLALAVSVLNIVFSIIAAVKASEDEVWQYPLTIPFIQ